MGKSKSDEADLRLVAKNLEKASSQASAEEVNARVRMTQKTSALTKIGVDAAAMKAQGHLARQQHATAKIAEVKAKKAIAVAGVQEGAAVAIERKTKVTSEKVDKAAASTKKRVEAVTVMQEAAKKKYKKVAGDEAISKAQNEAETAATQGEEKSTALTQAKTEQAEVDMHALDSKLSLKKANEKLQKDNARVKRSAKAVEDKKTEVQNMSLRLEASTDDADKLRIANEIKTGKNNLVTLINKQKFAALRATRAKSKATRALNRKNKLQVSQQSAVESVTKLTTAEIGAKVAFKNAKSEKAAKQQERTKYTAVVKLFTEAQEKAEAAKILAEKAKELNIKKIKNRMAFKKDEEAATESSEKHLATMKSQKKKVDAAKKFAKKHREARDKVTYAQKLERKARRSQLEAAAKMKTTKSLAKKKVELSEKARLREKSAKEAVKAARVAVEDERRRQSRKEKGMKRALEAKLTRAKDKTKEVKSKFNGLKKAAEESWAKKTKKEKRSRDNEAAGEKANKGFRKSERHLERAEKKSKLQNGAKESAKAAATAVLKKVVASAKAAKQAAETSKAAVQNARKKESTSKSAYMAAVAEERKSKAGSDAQMESLNKIKEKAFAAQKRDLAKAAKAQKDADEKASKTRVESWIPTELAAEVKNVKQKLDTENALLKYYWKQLTAVKLSKATATSKAQKAEVAASIKKAQKRVNKATERVKVLSSKHDVAKKKLEKQTAALHGRYMTSQMKKKQQASAAAAQAEIRLKENKSKTGRLMDFIKMAKSLSAEKTKKSELSTENLKSLEAKKTNLYHALSVAIGNKEQAQEKHKQKVRDYNDTYKKNQARVQAAKAKVTEWKTQQTQSKALGDKLVAELVQISKTASKDREARDSMARTMQTILKKNTAILSKINEKQTKQEESETAAKIREMRRGMSAEELKVHLEGQRKMAEKKTKVKEGQAFLEASRQKAQEAAEKDLQIATQVNVGLKKKRAAEADIKSAVKQQKKAVDSAKGARIDLDEAKTEKQIKKASSLLAGAKAEVQKTEEAYKKGQSRLKVILGENKAIAKQKEIVDAHLRAAAKTLKAQQEKRSKILETQDIGAKESVEKQDAKESNGKENIKKARQRLKEMEDKQAAKVKEQVKKAAQAKKENAQKIEEASAQVKEATSKHQTKQKEIWKKEKARREERADKQKALEKKQKQQEIAAKEHQLTKYRQERREKEGSKKVEAKAASATLESLKAREQKAKGSAAA